MRDAGWPIGFRLDPMIPYTGWREGYETVVTKINELKPEMVTFGALRATPAKSLRSAAKRNGRDESIFDFLSEVQVTKEITARGCSHVLRWSVMREGGEGSSGLGGLGTVADTAQQAGSLGGVIGGSAGSVQSGTVVGAGARVMGSVLHRKPKPVSYEVTVSYEVRAVADGTTASRNTFKASGQAAEDSVLPGLLEKVANGITSATEEWTKKPK
jgi:hypothetical protein